MKSRTHGKSVSRRSFLKTTGALAGAAAVAGSATGALTALAEGDERSSGESHVAKCCCRCNCFGSCYIDVTVRDGVVVNTRPAAMKDEHYNRTCLRGLSHITRIYDPDRVKYPMKRIGDRGSGEWERISWDDAIQLMADNFMEIREQYGNQAVAFWTALGNSAILNGGGGTPNFMTRFFNYIQGTDVNASVDMAGSVGQTRVLGGNYSSGLADLVNSHTIICWGYNATESTMHTWHLIADGMDAGAKLIVIDPTFTKIASKADQWIPIRPGTDTALALSLMQVLYAKGLHDEDFLLKHTCAPFLVKDDDGLYLRMSDLGVEPSEGPVNAQTGKPTVVDPIVVWDKGPGQGVSADEASDPALEGEYEVDGIRCRTAFSLLREEFDQYSPEVAEGITEVPQDVIVELAERLAEGPVAHLLGYGSQAYGNGVHVGMAMATLPAMTGNYGYPGAQGGGALEVLLRLQQQSHAAGGQDAHDHIALLPFRPVQDGEAGGEGLPAQGSVGFQHQSFGGIPRNEGSDGGDLAELRFRRGVGPRHDRHGEASRSGLARPPFLRARGCPHVGRTRLHLLDGKGD